MNIAISPQTKALATEQVPKPKSRHMVISSSPSVLTDIYQEDVNLAVWQSTLPENLSLCINDLIRQKPAFKAIMTVSPDSVYQHLCESFNGIEASEVLCQHITLLVDMFCTLFDLKYAGLRLKLLDRPMCPRFHVDRVPCRLVTTFNGAATQWLPHSAVNRNKLGAGSNGEPDESSGIIERPEIVQQLLAGDVALLKGELWHNNEGAGLVHRSPALSQGEHRLLLTLDFMS